MNTCASGCFKYSTQITAIIQLGSIAAVIWFFWTDIVTVIGGAYTAIGKKDYQSLEFQMAAGIVLGTLPIIVIGLLIKKFIYIQLLHQGSFVYLDLMLHKSTKHF